ncbi:MAG TPA: tyrosine-type recombinase/integrase [Polyangia bacterium]|jgi:site-specific recombinase XerD
MPPRVDLHLALPATTRRFLRTARGRRARLAVCALHRWLARRDVALADLTPTHVADFVAAPLGTTLGPATAKEYRNHLLHYLDWLHARGLLGFDPERLRAHPKRLPPIACEYLRTLAPTHHPRTGAGYTTALRRLHGWLDERGLDPQHLTRADLADWSQRLHTGRLSACYRLAVLLVARAYLRWRDERQSLDVAPDELIRPRDFPKLPKYLPRPLTQAADRELQRRLRASATPWHLALLLMRRTGLRSGELRALAFDCVRHDGRYPLLKVPLGKLLTERLVPLDPQGVALIAQLQALAPRPRPWLVPGVAARPTMYKDLHAALAAVAADLPDPARVTTHRLRHTYATEMLAGGMSLVGLMRLLGHRDYHMTLRYAAVTPELVGKEYAQAYDQLAARYELPSPVPAEDETSPTEMLDLLSRWLRTYAYAHPARQPLLKRLARLRVEFEHLSP